MENRGYLQQVISKSWGGQAELHHNWSRAADPHVAAGRLGASGWQLLRDSTCQHGLNGSQPKQRGWGRLTPGIPTPGVFFFCFRRLLGMVGDGFDWGGLCVSSSSSFANSLWSHLIAFIDNSNVLIIGDSLADCESSRKEHIVVQNVSLTDMCPLTYFLPIWITFHFLSILPLLLCVCWGARASQMAEQVLQVKASLLALHKLPDGAVRQLWKSSWDSKACWSSVSKLIPKDKPETFYFKFQICHLSILFSSYIHISHN